MAGHSMEPALRDGDWLLVDPGAFTQRAPLVGELVVATDPRAAERLLVKRVRALGAVDTLTIGGDHGAHRDEAIAVAGSAVVGRPWFRYAPLRRIGRIR